MDNSQPEIDDGSFYAPISNRSRQSASVVVPLVIGLVKPSSVVDVGRGDGTWLQVFRGYGVSDVLGVDGYPVNEGILKIPGPPVPGAVRRAVADVCGRWGT